MRVARDATRMAQAAWSTKRSVTVLSAWILRGASTSSSRRRGVGASTAWQPAERRVEWVDVVLKLDRWLCSTSRLHQCRNVGPSPGQRGVCLWSTSGSAWGFHDAHGRMAGWMRQGLGVKLRHLDPSPTQTLSTWSMPRLPSMSRPFLHFSWLTLYDTLRINWKYVFAAAETFPRWAMAVARIVPSFGEKPRMKGWKLHRGVPKRTE